MCLYIYVYFIQSMYSINSVIVGFWPSTANCDLCALTVKYSSISSFFIAKMDNFASVF